MSNRWTIVGLGEVLWDVFPDGAKFGGAPANFACSAAGFGGQHTEVHVVSGVGSDDLGSRAIETLQQKGVDTSLIETSDYPTGQVLVTLDQDGIASYEFLSNTAWDNLAWRQELLTLAKRTDAVCFGTLGQRTAKSRDTIQRFVKAVPDEALRISDINLRSPYYQSDVILRCLELANVLKLNDDELPILAQITNLIGSETELLLQLVNRYDLRCVALTRGARGAVLVRGNDISDISGVETNVADTVGAGDAFTAALALGLLAGHTLDQINQSATQLAAFVCSQTGATPDIPVAFVP